MDKHYDLIILGGGCAGLSLALRLAELREQAPKTLIIEQRPAYSNDRTWCFWDEGNPALKDWADHTWSSFKVQFGDKQLVKNCSQNPYVMISAQTFYTRAIQNITANSQRFTLNHDESVLAVIKQASQTWRITTNMGVYTANHIVDTRPASQINDDMSLLWQSFIGFEIEVNQGLFDAQQFTLMDIDQSFKNGLGFTYVLPLSSNRALIEYTVFCEQAMSASSLQPYLDVALSKYTNEADYKVLRKECGQLPMGNQIVKKSDDPNYIFAGLYAGAARPSSGYAFQRIQRWAGLCEQSWIQHQSFIPAPKDAVLMSIMDDVFLHVLQSNPAASATLFFSFFSKAKLISTVRFLSDHATLPDLAIIILSMPTILFLKSLPSYVKKRLFSSLHASLPKSSK
jgi:lycopene beta-cyclase